MNKNKNPSDYDTHMKKYPNKNPLASMSTEQLFQLASRLQVRIAEIIDELEDRSNHKHFLPFPIHRKKIRLLLSPLSEADELEKKLANVGVNVDIQRGTNDYAMVTIYPIPQEIRLAPAEADLFEILCDSTGPASQDALVPWKSIPDIIRQLKQKTGKNVNPHAISASINRIRKALKVCGINKYLVQSNRRMGYRFARRIKPIGKIPF